MASARAPSRGSSPVWGPDGFRHPAAGESHATCNKCGSRLAYPGSWYGTTHLARHLKSKRCRSAAAQQQQEEEEEEEEEEVAPVVVGEPFQPSGSQVHYSTTTAANDAVDSAELHHLLQAAPTAAAGSFQPGGQVCNAAGAAFAFADHLQLHGHGGAAEDSGDAASYSSTSNVMHQTAASSMCQPPDYFSDQDSDTTGFEDKLEYMISDLKKLI